jgi:CheY-like chemotaxis protein
MGLILVISEDAVEIETIKTSLSVHGWWVTVAGDRQTALQVAADQAPQLVIVDDAVHESTELVKAFGSAAGGPGVLAAAPEDPAISLALRQAGADELLTKPVDGPRLLEAVERCLSAPRQPIVERAPAAESAPLLSSQEIFGDMLRELEEVDGLGAEATPTPDPVERQPTVAPPTPVTSPVAPSAAPAAMASAAAAPEEPLPARREPQAQAAAVPAPPLVEMAPEPPAEPAAPTGDSEPTPAESPSTSPSGSSEPSIAEDTGGSQAPVVSLAGLFDGESMTDAAHQSGPPPAPPKASDGEELDSLWNGSTPAGEWRGEERRGSDRPWTAPDEPALPESHVLEEPATLSSEELQPLVDEPEVEVVDDVAAAIEAGAQVQEAVERPVDDEPEMAGEFEMNEPAPGFFARMPRKALLLGSIAAALLVVAGVYFLMNPGAGEPDAAAATSAPATESFTSEELTTAVEETEAEADETAEAPTPAAQPVEAPEPVVTQPELPRTGEPEPVVTQPEPQPTGEAEPMNDLDLEAIVEQELERREEELRQVFLEEEKRLLRELGSLDSAESNEAGEAADDDGDGSGSGGRSR